MESSPINAPAKRQLIPTDPACICSMRERTGRLHFESTRPAWVARGSSRRDAREFWPSLEISFVKHLRAVLVFMRPLWSRASKRFSQAIWQGRRAPKSLTVLETTSLGDRRFVSVIQFERQRFLIGSSPSSVTLLAQLGAGGESGNEVSAAISAEEGSQ
jgi:Flagellar biosynthesis protein, FliO